jgi:spore germination protein KB
LIFLAYSATIAILVYLGIEVVSRVAYIIMPLMTLGMIITLSLLTNFYDPNFLLPWQGHGLSAMLQTGLLRTAMNIDAFLLVIFATAFQNIETMKKAALFGLGTGVALKTAFLLAFMATFDYPSGTEKALPFYEMARLIYLTRFLQRVEALLIMMWVIAGLLAITISFYISLYLLTRLFNLPTMRPLLPALTLILLQLALLPKSLSDTTQLDGLLMLVGDVGIFIIPLLLFTVTLLKGRKDKQCVTE